jgi:hypothetical protein
MSTSNHDVGSEPPRARRRLPASLVVVLGLTMLALSASTAVASWAAAEPLPEGTKPVGDIADRVQLRLAGTGSCLGTGADEPELRLVDCHDATAQAWIVGDDGSLRPDAGSSSEPERCVEVAEGSTSAGASVRLGQCDAGDDGYTVDAQQWSVARTSSGVRLVSSVDVVEHVAPVRCLSAAAAGPGAALVVASCSAATGTSWQLEPVLGASL